MPPDRPPNTTRRLQIIPTHVRRTPPSYVLPLQLRAVVPPCAQLCLATYIQEQYKCSHHGIACLCQVYSSQGFTLGELAYLCLNRSCKQTDRRESVDQYNICTNISDAVQATYTVLTAPAQTPLQTLSSTVRTISPTSRKPTVHFTSPSPRPKSIASRTMHSSVSQRSSKASAVPAAIPDSNSSSVSSSSLTPADIAGIVLGALSLVVLILAAIWRRKYRNASSRSYDYVERAPPRPSTLLHIKPADDVRTIDRDTISCWQQLATAPAHRYPMHNQRSLAGAKGNPSSAYSARIPPRRPERPRSGPMHQRRSGTDYTTATLFKEDAVPPVPSLPEYWSRTNTEARPNPTGNLAQTQRLPPAKMALPGSRNSALSLQIPTSATRSATVLPPLAIPPFPSAELRSYNDQRGSIASGSRSRDSSGSLLNYYASSEAGVLPSPLVDRPAPLEREGPLVLSGTLDVEVMQSDSPTAHNRRNTAASDTSFESIDDDEAILAAAEEAHEEAEKQVTPVKRSSPHQRTPIAEIRYPRIPRSANQKVLSRSLGGKGFAPGLPSSPRPPKAWHQPQNIYSGYAKGQSQQPEWPLQNEGTSVGGVSKNTKLGSSSIAAKRRGENAAHDLELKFNKENTAYAAFHPFDSTAGPAGARVQRNVARPHQPESPLKGYGKTTSSGLRSSRGQQRTRRKSPGRRNPEEATLESPKWDPKVTPARRGNDLYLQVGPATPSASNFSRLK